MLKMGALRPTIAEASGFYGGPLLCDLVDMRYGPCLPGSLGDIESARRIEAEC